MLFCAFILACCLVLNVLVYGHEELLTIGHGIQRLKRSTHRGIKKVGACAGPVLHWNTKAVVDNFAPVEKQQFWAGNGQRYWTNQVSHSDMNNNRQSELIK